MSEARRLIAIVAEPLRVRRVLIPAFIRIVAKSTELSGQFVYIRPHTTDELLFRLEYPGMIEKPISVSAFDSANSCRPSMFACVGEHGDRKRGIKAGEINGFLNMAHVVVMVTPEEVEQLRQGQFSDQLIVLGISMRSEARDKGKRQFGKFKLYLPEHNVLRFIHDRVLPDHRFLFDDTRAGVDEFVDLLEALGLADLRDVYPERYDTLPDVEPIKDEEPTQLPTGAFESIPEDQVSDARDPSLVKSAEFERLGTDCWQAIEDEEDLSRYTGGSN